MSNLNIIKRHLNKFEFDHLYYMTPMENAPSILAIGILSYNMAIKIPHHNVALWSVQKRRKSKIPGTGKRIHDYVPLYFATQTPMQRVLTIGTRRKSPKIKQKELVFIEIDAIKIFEIPGVIFSDGNAASNNTHFYDNIADLEKLDWRVINTRNCYTPEFKRKKAAEVLVPDTIKVNFFTRIVVFNQEADHELNERVKMKYNELKRYLPNYNRTHLTKYRYSIDQTHYYENSEEKYDVLL